MGRLSPYRETNFSGANGDREVFTFPVTDHEQDWQPFPVDSYSVLYMMAIHTAQGTLSLSKNCTSRESVSPLSRLIRGFRNKYH